MAHSLCGGGLINTTRSRARQNVAHHYDLSDQLYELFLDKDRQYSCAYFHDGREDLDAAQLDRSATSRQSC